MGAPCSDADPRFDDAETLNYYSALPLDMYKRFRYLPSRSKIVWCYFTMQLRLCRAASTNPFVLLWSFLVAIWQTVCLVSLGYGCLLIDNNALLERIPDSVDLRVVYNSHPGPYAREPYCSSSACAVAYGIRIAAYGSGGDVNASRSWIYYWARHAAGMLKRTVSGTVTYLDIGAPLTTAIFASMRSGAINNQSIGAGVAQECNFSSSTIAKHAAWYMFTDNETVDDSIAHASLARLDSSTYHIRNAWLLPLHATATDMCHIIRLNLRPVLVTLAIKGSIVKRLQQAADETVLYNDVGSTGIIGYERVAIVGCSVKERWVLVRSSVPSFGKWGYFRVAFETLEDRDMCREMWWIDTVRCP
jgi:hypothetical protein